MALEWYEYLLTFIVPALSGLIVLVKKQGIFESKGNLIDYNVTAIRTDLTEVKGDIKELRRDQAELTTLIQELRNITDRVKRVETILDDHDKRLWPQMSGALRQIDVIKVRLDNVEEQLRTAQRARKNSRYDAIAQRYNEFENNEENSGPSP